MKMRTYFLVGLMAVVLGSPATAAEPAWSITALCCDGLVDPAGIDVVQPPLRWQLAGDVTGLRQTSYRILVATTRERLDQDQGDAWDSGEVASATSTGVPYVGTALTSERRYWWKVCVWDQDRTPRWSPPATFLTGKLRPEDWRGTWIGPALARAPWVEPVKHGAPLPPPPPPAPGALPWHRHGGISLGCEVTVPKPVTRAVLSYAGLGYAEVLLDGRQVGDHVMEPGFREYHVRVPYLTREVTDLVRGPGPLRIEVVLVDGWYALQRDPWAHKLQLRPYVDLPKLRFDLTLEHADGSVTHVASDPTWRWSLNEVTRSWIPEEDVDLRLADPATRSWQPVIPATPPTGRLQHQVEPPNVVVGTITPPITRWDAAKGTATYEVGREVAGHVRFQARGPAGTTLRITTQPTAPYPRTSTVILAGTGAKEVYEPRFCHAAMRRVVISGLRESPEPGDLVIQRVSSLREPSGAFRCSDTFVNGLEAATRRTCGEYTTFLPNDPVREWKAWTQDIQSIFRSSTYLFKETERQYRRWEEDILDGQRPGGELPEVAPGAVFDKYNSPWWGGCAVFLAWEWYQAYGDDHLLRTHYEGLGRYLAYLERQAGKTGLQDWGLLDWNAIEMTPRAMVNTPAHALYARIMERTATLLNKPEDATRYAAMADRVTATLNRTFLDPATGIYGQPGWKLEQGWKLPIPLDRLHEAWWSDDRPCTQTGQVLPLALGLVPADVRPKTEAALLREIAAHQGRLSTGFVGTPYLLDVLADLDPEACWRLVTAQEFPSWYSMTTGSGNDLLKEDWAGGGALMPVQGGSVAAWCYRALGGIRSDPTAPGFRNVLIKPTFVRALAWVECDHDGPYGRISAHWRRQEGQITLDLRIPGNSTATVLLPGKTPQSLTAGRHRLTFNDPTAHP